LRKLMKESVIRHLLVCDTKGALVGVVSDRDINGKDGNHVRDVMTPNPITVRSDTPVGTVTTMMLARRINCVPVVDDGRLLGIVTTSDLLMALQCVLRLIEQLSLPLDHDEQCETTDSRVGDEVEEDGDLASAEEAREYKHCHAGK
jgi:predicted transcriptional regulator